MTTTSRPRRPMVTASLALQLLESAAQGMRSTECSSPTTAFNSRSSSSSSSSSSDLSTSTAVTQRKIESLQRALRETTAAAASPPTHDPSYATKASLVSPTKNVSAAASTPSSDDYSLGSWDETEDDDEDDEDDQDRGRLGAAATTLSRLSREESLPHHEEEEVTYGADIRRQFFDERNDSTALDEFDHPALAGAAAALHRYVISEGDVAFLEKAYEIARGVAGSKHSLTVAFDACRMALAVGYVHTLTKGAPDMANTFAREHSLCKLAQSLKPYWSRSPPSTPEAEVEWEECMSSLLEVASSVALMTGERDVLSVLDIEAYSGVTEATGAYLVRRPGVLQQYQDVGGTCLRQHLLGPVTREYPGSE